MQRKEPRPRGASCSGRSTGPRRAVASPLVDEHVHEGDLQPASARGPSFRHGLGRRADDGGGGKHEMGGAQGEDKAGEWIGLLVFFEKRVDRVTGGGVVKWAGMKCWAARC